MKQKILYWLPSVIAAVILLQASIPKLIGVDQTVALFTQLNLLGMDEAVSRIGTGIAELVASGLLFHKKTQKFGALGGVALMLGALFFHATNLGFEGMNGQMAGMAVVALIASGFVLLRDKIKG